MSSTTGLSLSDGNTGLAGILRKARTGPAARNTLFRLEVQLSSIMDTPQHSIGFLHHLKSETACSFSADIFSLEEPQHFVTVPRTSLLALGPDKLLLNTWLYYS